MATRWDDDDDHNDGNFITSTKENNANKNSLQRNHRHAMRRIVSHFVSPAHRAVSVSTSMHEVVVRRVVREEGSHFGVTPRTFSTFRTRHRHVAVKPIDINRVHYGAAP